MSETDGVIAARVAPRGGFYIGTKSELRYRTPDGTKDEALPEKQELISINATPDDNYVLRILQAYLEAEEATYVTDNTAGAPPTNMLCIAMNATSAKRAELLRAAIAKLTS